MSSIKNLIETFMPIKFKTKTKIGIEYETIFPGLTKLEYFSLEIFKSLIQKGFTANEEVMDDSMRKAETFLNKIENRMEEITKEIQQAQQAKNANGSGSSIHIHKID